MSDNLDTDQKDVWVAAARGALTLIPFVGGLIGEVLAVAVPRQRQDRIVDYIRLLEIRIEAMEEDKKRTALVNAEKIDLIERGGFQAARATSQERIALIVEVVARGLEADEAEIIRRKRLAELLGEIDDDEVAILTAYGHSYAGSDRNAFDSISRPNPPSLGAGWEVIEQNKLYDLGVDHLLRMGLLERNYSNVKKGQLPEFDPKTGGFKGSIRVSFLGRMLLNEIGIITFRD